MKRDIYIRGLSEPTYLKLIKRKENDGFRDEDWPPWLDYLTADIHIEDTPGELIQMGTKEGLFELWMKNFVENFKVIDEGKSVSDIVPEESQLEPNKDLGSAIIMGRGPSIFTLKHLEKLAASDYAGALFLSDGILIDALKKGVTPDKFPDFYILSVDGNREKIWKWYDDPLVDQYANKIKFILNSTVAHNVYERIKKAGGEVYWFNAMMDYWPGQESVTRVMSASLRSPRRPNGLVRIATAGNAGASLWIQACSIFRRFTIGLIGLDMGYADGTPLEQTYYYDKLFKAVQGNMEFVKAQFSTMYNPDFKCMVLQDPIFKHYTSSFYEMLATGQRVVKTYNSSHGALVGRPDVSLECIEFDEFLSRFHE